jgi:hypothetical protein
MELDLQSLFGLLCTAVLIGCDPATPPSPLPLHLGFYTTALLVSRDRRHLFVTPWLVPRTTVQYLNAEAMGITSARPQAKLGYLRNKSLKLKSLDSEQSKD